MLTDYRRGVAVVTRKEWKAAHRAERIAARYQPYIDLLVLRGWTATEQGGITTFTRSPPTTREKQT